MQKTIFPSLLFCLALFVATCTPKIVPDPAPRPYENTSKNKVSGAPAQNIILLIGDGMGLAQVSTRYYYDDQTPVFDRFRHIGLHENSPVGAKITDSAAGATAFSTGYKSYNGAIGLDGDTIAQTTIAEIAHRKGKTTGMIATSSITHATPASFYAHVKSRQLAEDIAQQLIDAPIDFFAGGGLQYFNQRNDGLDGLAELRKNGYQVSTQQLGSGQLNSDQKHGFLLADDGMPKMQEGRGDFLPQATQLALDYLSQNREGFFLMVEGSQIDWGGHANDTEYIIEEMKDFDATIKVALDFAEKAGNTLVIVTADHETGGFSLSAAEVFGKRDYRQIKASFSTGGHSASLIPIFAFGPDAERYIGIYPNNALFGKMMDSFGFNLE